MIIQAKPKALHLNHPILNVPAMARILGYYSQKGANVGLELQFADGHTANLTYQEIRKLQGAKNA